MNHLSTTLYGILCIALVLTACQKDQSTTSVLFETIEGSDSGIRFNNQLQEDVATRSNLLDFDYFYNGAGVGTADLNNDGRVDIFFCGNQVPNKLFINEGNWKFRDVTESSGVNIGKNWSTGVTFADVNGDGWLDIYVSQGGPYERDMRKNTLYMNNRDLTFTEAAELYGLADMGISTQSAFFDFDRDGDLDCFVMNESELYGYDPITFHRRHLEARQRYEPSLSHLYENRDGKYVDVSREAGIDQPTFGLGLVISDINNDDWPDIYVANDYYQPDNLYINRKDGTFSDRSKIHMAQISFYGMGADIADINNDGLQDIYVLDMASKDHYRSKTLMASMDVESFDLLVNRLGFPNQYMFNSMMVNDGNDRFQNVAHLSGLAKTDWSWAALMEDLDHDGLIDILVTNGYRRYALDNDFKNKVVEAKMKYNNVVPLDVKRQLYNEMPSEALPNVIFKNLGDMQFSDVSAQWGLDMPTFSNGAALADFDDDGDWDLVINNIDQEALLYRNTSVEKQQGNYLVVRVENEDATLVKVRIQAGPHHQMREIKRVRGYMSAVQPQAHFGLGEIDKIDTLIARWPDGSQLLLSNLGVNRVLKLSKDQAQVESSKTGHPEITQRVFQPALPSAIGLDFRHQENEYNDFALEVLLPQKQSTLGPRITKGDINGDGNDDLIISGAAGQATGIYVQDGGNFRRTLCLACDEDKAHEDMQPVLFDADQDGDQDLYVVSGGNEFPPGHPFYEDRLYLNNGLGQFSRHRTGLDYDNQYSGSTAVALDYDSDGDMDLLLANRLLPQNYPVNAPSFLLENKDGILSDVTDVVFPALRDYGIVNDLVVNDFDEDGSPDIFLVGEWTTPAIFYNKQGSWEKAGPNILDDKLSGWWFSIHETDVNADGQQDYVLGNVGLNLKHKASPNKPFKVYASDFDKNDRLDIVLSSTYKEREVPARGRECSSEQMPFILDKFPTYDQFASASLIDIYGDEELKSAYSREVEEFRSILLVNRGGNGFEVKYLPMEAQVFPFLDAVFLDINQDGFEDMVAAGCIYNTEVETPRLDAGTGLILLSNGSDGYVVSKNPKHMIYIDGNIKSLIDFRMASGEKFVMAGINNQELGLFRIGI